MKYRKIFSVLTLSAVMMTSVYSVYAEDEQVQSEQTTVATQSEQTAVVAGDTVVKVYLNNEEINFGTEYACVMNNRTMVPIRATATALGMDIAWDGKTNTMTFTRGEDVITHVMGTNVLVINGVEKVYEAYSAVKNNYTYMPLIMLADVTGLDPEWDSVTKSVHLVSQEDETSLNEDESENEETDEEVTDEDDEEEEEETVTKKKASKNNGFSDDISMIKYLTVTQDTGKDMDGGKGHNYVFERTGGGYVVANLHNELYVRVLDKDLNVVASNRFYTDDDYEIGGYFFYNNCHYVIYGKDNTDRTNKSIAYKIVKYNTAFDSVKYTNVSGTNCRIDKPFQNGDAEMILNGTTLTVSDTGIRLPENNKSLPCNIVMSFDVDDLTFLGYDITSEGNLDGTLAKNSGLGQKIAYIDDNSIACAALSDERPAGLYLRAEEIGSESESGDPTVITLMKANADSSGDLGIELGGFEMSDKYCIVTGTSVEQSKGVPKDTQKNVFVATASKSELNEKYTNISWITDYDDEDEVTILYQKLIKVSDNLFLIMWQENRKDDDSVIKYGYLDADGNLVTNMKRADKSGLVTINGKLSSSQPLLASDKKSIYYAMTENDGDPIELYQMTIDVPETTAGKKGK